MIQEDVGGAESVLRASNLCSIAFGSELHCSCLEGQVELDSYDATSLASGMD